VMVHQTTGDLRSVVPTFTPPPPSVAPPVPPSERKSKPTTPMTMDIDMLEHGHGGDAPLSRGGAVKGENQGVSTIMFFVGIAAIVTLIGFVAMWAWGPEKDLKRTVAAAPTVSFSLTADAPPTDPPPVAPPVATTNDDPAPAASAAASASPRKSNAAKKAPAPKPSSRQKH